MNAGVRRIATLLAAIACAALARPAGAYFEETRVDARALAMGGAAGATIRGPGAWYWNPAALAGVTTREALLDVSSPYGVPDLTESALSVAGRWRETGLALGWHRLGVSGAFAEDLFALAGGRRFTLPRRGHALELGLSLKLQRAGFSSFADPATGAAVDYGAASAFDSDLGARWTTPWNVDFAWVSRNLIGSELDVVDGGGAFRLPRLQELTAAYRWNPQSTVNLGWTQSERTGEGTINGGVEIWFYDVFALRSGFTHLQGVVDATTLNGASEFDFTGGIGVRHRGWEVDGAVSTHPTLGASYRAGLHWTGRRAQP